MQTFKLQVEDLLGRTVSDTSGLSDMLNASAREVSDLLPKDVLIRNATLATVTSNPTTIENSRILAVSRNGFYANEIPFGQYGRTVDSGSIHYADPAQDRDPIFYFEGKSLRIMPAPTVSQNGEILKYDYPSSVAHGDTGISSFPDAAEYAVTLGAAAKFMIKLAAEDQNNEDIELHASSLSHAATLKQEYEKELQRIGQQK